MLMLLLLMMVVTAGIFICIVIGIAIAVEEGCSSIAPGTTSSTEDVPLLLLLVLLLVVFGDEATIAVGSSSWEMILAVILVGMVIYTSCTVICYSNNSSVKCVVGRSSGLLFNSGE